jgi:glucosamine kinase
VIPTLAIDIGQTGSRLLLVGADGHREVWESAAGRAGADPEEALIAAVAEVAGRLPALDTLAAGLTGLQGRAGRARDVLERVAPLAPARRVVIADDALTSYLGAIGLRPGVVVAAGTGAVALATDGASRHGRVDGWGYLVGDLGSGFWIGRRGLESALRALDGRAGSPRLLSLARETFGDLGLLPQRLAADPDRVRRVALFAEPVALAAHEGDDDAVRIWAEAAGLLAEAAAAAARRAGLDGEIVVSWTGRLFAAGDLLLGPFGAGLAVRLPAAVLTPPLGDGLDGVERLAQLDELPALDPLLTSAVRETMPVGSA